MLRENAQAEEPRGGNTEALIRGGRLRSSVEAIVMIVEQRKPATDVWFGSTGNRKIPHAERKAAAFSRQNVVRGEVGPGVHRPHGGRAQDLRKAAVRAATSGLR